MCKNKLDIVRRVQFLTGRLLIRSFSPGAVAVPLPYGSRRLWHHCVQQLQLLVTSFVCHDTKDCEVKVLHSRKSENNRLSVHVFGVHVSAQNLSCFLIVSLFCNLDCASKRLDESNCFFGMEAYTYLTLCSKKIWISQKGYLPLKLCPELRT